MNAGCECAAHAATRSARWPTQRAESADDPRQEPASDSAPGRAHLPRGPGTAYGRRPCAAPGDPPGAQPVRPARSEPAVAGGPMDWWDPAVAVAGLLVGVVVGLTGMGGGALMTPVLIF